jgi:hypothetical protein
LLIDLARLVARIRLAVERDGYAHEITLIPDPESPTRLVVALSKLFHGMQTMGLPEP